MGFWKKAKKKTKKVTGVDAEKFSLDPRDLLDKAEEVTKEQTDAAVDLVEDAVDDVREGDIADILNPLDETKKGTEAAEEILNIDKDAFQDLFGDELGSFLYETRQTGGVITPTTEKDFKEFGSEELFGPEGDITDVNEGLGDILDDLEEEFNTGFGNFEDAPMDEQIDAFTGKTAAENAVQAAKDQVEFSRRALGLLREDLRPFREILSPEQMANIRDLASDPSTQQDFLTNNPLLDEIANEIKSTSFAATGGMSTDDIIARTFGEQGNDLINQQINRALPLLSAGQSSAAQSAVGSSDLLTGAGNAMAAGMIGQANAQQTGAQNVAGLVGMIASLFMSDIRLKKNLKRVGSKGDLTIYRWEWNDKAKEFGLKGSGEGHIAQEVQDIYPELVKEHSSGYLMIDYGTDKTVNYV